ncbi:MAG: HlyD family type I secretion periplasmic adaptor subunit [Betaproteobacteria bacterium]|nr:HlyD family type I secretion periplasmic adaptor subunit [Betaproteobacteria bacterium]
MEPANKPPVDQARQAGKGATVVEFLPDADEIERSPLPRLAQITLHVLLVTLVSFLIWATFSEVDLIVTARGRLVTPLPNILVQPLETAIITSLDVRVGQVVKKGERLATLDPTFAEADQSQLRTRLSSLETQSQRLEAEISGKKGLNKPDANADTKLQAQLAAERQANYRAQMTKLEQNIARLRATIDTNQRDQQMLAERVRSLKEIEAMQEKLTSMQYGSRAKLLESQDKRLEVEREMLLARSREQELRRDLAANEAEKSAFEKSWRQKTMEDMLSTSRDREDLKEQLLKADKRQMLVTLVSPADAVVLEMAKLSQGSVARGGEPMFTLVPIASDLEAEVQVDALDVGYVKLGDVAQLKFDAFPYQRHGGITAKVRTISEDAFRRDATQAHSPDAFYLSRIAMNDMQLKKMPEKARLLPGMTLSAEIVVGKRSVISYLLWPLTKALDESIREP